MPNLTNWFNKQGYTTIACDARGHGSRRPHTPIDWVGTVEDYDNIIRDRGRPAILVGSSMGGSVALNLAHRNPFVKKVFALATPHGNDAGDHIFTILRTKRRAPRMERAFPKHFLKCKPTNKDKFFLIHASNDPVVPLTNFERSREQLCIPPENTLVIDDLPWWSCHLTVNHHPAPLAFFEKHLGKKGG